jgi:hemerythrin superfamily protein
MARKSNAPKKTAVAKPTKSRVPGKDAIAILKADHMKVQGLFDRYGKARSKDTKKKIAQQICVELTAHAQVEEEIFYPAAKAGIKAKDLIDEATVEHKTAKDLIAEIKGGAPADELYDAKVKVLGEYIKHHVKEEQSEMFPAARKAGLDMKALGRQIADRKKALLGESKGSAAGNAP